MNRMDELREMQMLCEDTPPELEFTVQKAVNRAARKEKHRKRARRVLAPLASLAGAAAVFVLLVNISVPFAMACNQVPGLRELTRVAAYDPSLRAALEHDYIELVKRTETVDGMTVHLEYLIADRSNLTLFYRVTDEQGREIQTIPELLDADGERLDGYSSSWGYPGEEEMNHADFLFSEGTLPDRIGVRFELQDNTDPGAYTPVGEVVFDAVEIHFQYLKNSRTVEVGQPIAVLGQTILIERVEFYPLQTRIVYRADPANTAKLTSLPFYLTDSKGNHIGNDAGGITGIGNRGAEDSYTAILDTVWWDADETYTLCLDKAAAVPRDAETVFYDPATKTFTGLPGYISVAPYDGVGDDYDTKLVISCTKPDFVSSVFDYEVRDAETGESIAHADGYGSGTTSWRPWDGSDSETADETAPGYFTNLMDFSAYDRPVELTLGWAPSQDLTEPIRLKIP